MWRARLAVVCLAVLLSGGYCQGIKYTIANVLMVRLWPQGDSALENLGRLCEWLEYNIAIGVEHFYIYDDAQAEHERFGDHPVMRTYIDDGYVTYTLLQPHPPYRGWSNSRQDECYNRAVADHRADVMWFLFADMDEFVRLERDRTLTDLLERLQPDSTTTSRLPALAVTQFLFRNWFMSGLLADPGNNDLRMIEQYLWRDNYAWRTWSEDRNPNEYPPPRPPVGTKVGRTKMLVLAPAHKGWMNVHEATLSYGKTQIVSVDDGFLMHYWKLRASNTSWAAIHYYPQFAEQWGDTIHRKLYQRSQRAEVPFSTLSAGPFPELSNQRTVNVEELHVSEDNKIKPPTNNHIQGLRDTIARLRQKRLG